MPLQMHHTERCSRVGLLADTHGLLRPEVRNALEGSDMVLHAGDVGKSEVLEGLAALHPPHGVVAVRGNVDRGGWADGLRHTERITIAGWTILLTHIFKDVELDQTAREADILITGHSHAPRISHPRPHLLHINPGAAGPRRFKLPVAVAILELGERMACVEGVVLG